MGLKAGCESGVGFVCARDEVLGARGMYQALSLRSGAGKAPGR